jgi:hypothetical protein
MAHRTRCHSGLTPPVPAPAQRHWLDFRGNLGHMASATLSFDLSPILGTAIDHS